MTADRLRELGWALDLHHDADVRGIIHVCGISTDNGMERGRGHAMRTPTVTASPLDAGRRPARLAPEPDAWTALTREQPPWSQRTSTA